MLMAMAKQATTIATQTALAARDLAVEMCTRPWIVELSKNSRIAAEAIVMTSVNFCCQSCVKILKNFSLFHAYLEICFQQFVSLVANWGFAAMQVGSVAKTKIDPVQGANSANLPLRPVWGDQNIHFGRDSKLCCNDSFVKLIMKSLCHKSKRKATISCG